MLPTLSRPSTAVLIAMGCVASMATFNAGAQPASGAHGMPPYQLFSPDERAVFCEQMAGHAACLARRRLHERRHVAPSG
jgi:hypothetical protein